MKGWEKEAPEMPLFIGAHYRPAMPEILKRIGDGLLVRLDEELEEHEQAFWAGQPCQLELAPPAWPDPIQAENDAGEPMRILQVRETSFGPVLIVEGTEPVRILDGEGQELSFATLEPHEGATQLRWRRNAVAWSGQRTVSLSELPDEELLLADNGVRWRWEEQSQRKRRRAGFWIQLLESDEGESEAVIDPRAAYCEEGVREVRTKKGGGAKNAYRVWGARRESYQLELDRPPPEGSTLFIPSNTSGLSRQRQAIYRIKDRPLPHHRGLLTLCEDPTKVRWLRCRPQSVAHWYLLADENWDGTRQQREFVEKALGTPDFAFLEGPPGSGKTHAICELVLQLIDAGKTVLLCSTTHVAVDNVLERLTGVFEQVEAVRIGRSGRVDPRVRSVQIDERIATLTEKWIEAGIFPELDERELERTVEATILSSVNLTCGTSTGILAHPYIRRAAGTNRNDSAGPSWPYFDYLIIDEASKSTFQEFLVPAQLARRWIIVGDVRQLPPFSEPKDIEASIAEVSNENEEALPTTHQAALLILFRLQRREAGMGRVHWLIEEPPEVIAAICKELEAREQRGDDVPTIVSIVNREPQRWELSLQELEDGEQKALMLLAADWILFPPELRDRVSKFLPARALPLKQWEPLSDWAFRFSWWHDRYGRFERPVRERKRRYQTALELAKAQTDFLHENTWSKQIAWRLGRVHQLSSAKNDSQRERRQDEVETLLPATGMYDWVPSSIDAIRDVGVRSVIETFQVCRTHHRARRLSALTEAIPPDVWAERSVLLTYQHRMHPEISDFPRVQFYEGEALNDANTLDGREQRIGWSFGLPEIPSRRIWVDVRGVVSRGINQQEIDEMQAWLEIWVSYAEKKRRLDGKPWEVACLSFYNRQELGTRDMLRRLTGKIRGETRFDLPNTTISCATVDRFQGREADLVLLSLRNTRRAGHMDSPNRLNVAITRARFQLIIFGHHRYFSQNCPSEELNALAEGSVLYELGRRAPR